MSRKSEEEQRRLWGAPKERVSALRTSDGLTVGTHPDHIVTAATDEEARIKAGILGEGNQGGWQAGLTFGSPLENYEREQRNAALDARGTAMQERERADAAELAMYREAAALEHATEALYAIDMNDPASMRAAVQAWDGLTPEQRTSMVMAGDIDEGVADWLHTQLMPFVAREMVAENAAKYEAAGRMQRGLALMQIQQERGMTDDQFAAYRTSVIEYATSKGIPLTDDIGTIQWETNFRAAEVMKAEEARADANARFQAEVLNTETTDITSGLKVLGANGYQPVVEGGEILSKPDFAAAAARVLHGGGHPMHDDADAIRMGILSEDAMRPSEQRDWRESQKIAGELFSEAEKARIETKLGER
jgi:hypothetical protein